MFVRHNMEPWQEPPDFEFEPSPIWHDDPEIVTNEYAKVFLRNMVTKSREGLAKVQGTVTLKQQEVDDIRTAVQANKDKDAVSSVQILLLLRQLTKATTRGNPRISNARKREDNPGDRNPHGTIRGKRH